MEQAQWQADRQQFIEDSLYWIGTVGNIDVRRRFGIAKSLAALDIARYRENQPAPVLYEPRRKVFVAPDNLRPLYANQSLERFLRLTMSGEMAVGDAVDLAVLMPPPRPAPVEVSRAVVNAIIASQEIEVRYTSMSSGQSRRWLAPHAIGHDGLRYHCRAFDFAKSRFSDFVLGRIGAVYGKRRRSVDPKTDDDWFSHVTLELVANPALTAGAQAAVQAEYPFANGILTHSVRRAMLVYLNTRMLLHSDFGGMPRQELFRQLVPRDPPAFDALLDAASPRHKGAL